MQDAPTGSPPARRPVPECDLPEPHMPLTQYCAGSPRKLLDATNQAGQLPDQAKKAMQEAQKNVQDRMAGMGMGIGTQQQQQQLQVSRGLLAYCQPPTSNYTVACGWWHVC